MTLSVTSHNTLVTYTDKAPNLCWQTPNFSFQTPNFGCQTLNPLTNSGQFWVWSHTLTKPWFQVPLCTPQQTLTNSKSVTHPCHTPLPCAPITPKGLPDISGSQNSSSPNPESLNQPLMNFGQTSPNFNWTLSNPDPLSYLGITLSCTVMH